MIITPVADLQLINNVKNINKIKINRFSKQTFKNRITACTIILMTIVNCTKNLYLILKYIVLFKQGVR